MKRNYFGATLTLFALTFFLFGASLSANAQMQYRKALDFNGDGKADIALIRRSNDSQANAPINWFIQNPADGSYSATQWGNGSVYVDGPSRGDRIVPGDYDGDGKGDFAVVRKTGGYLYWWILNSSDGAYRSVQFGVADITVGDYPIPGDYDGDGKTDIAVARETGLSNNLTLFYILQSSNGQFRALNIPQTPAGSSGSVCRPTQGNFDGDSKADPTIYCRQTTPEGNSAGYFISIRSVDGVYTKQQWGHLNDQPVFGDFDGDGRTDLAIVRGASQISTNIEWYIKGSTGAYISIQFGYTGGSGNITARHITAQADYDGDGKTDIAVYDWRNGIYYILQSSLNNQMKMVYFGGSILGSGLEDAPVRLINNTYNNGQ
jgi:hypothetical protein